MRITTRLAGSLLAAACFPVVASAQVIFQNNFDTPGAGSLFTTQTATNDPDNNQDFMLDFHYDYSTFEYLLFPQGPANPPTFQFIPPAPGGTTTRGLRISVNDVAPAQAFGVQLIPNGVNVSGNWKMEAHIWMNYNGGALGGTGSTETFVAGLNLDSGVGVVGPTPSGGWTTAPANGWAFTATGEGGNAGDYRMYDRGDPIDDGPNYPKVNGIWPANDEFRFDRTTGELLLTGGLRVNDRPHNHFNSYYDTVFPGDAIGGGQFETRGAPGKNWVPVTIEQSGNEVLFYMNGKIIGTLFRETAAAGQPSIGYTDEFNSIASPNIDNFIIIDNLVITQNAATPQFTATSGDYSNGANWNGTVPNGAGLKAEFAGAAGPANVNVNVPVTLRSMAFNSANSYTVAGANTITLTGEQNSMINNGGNHTVSAPVVTQGHVSVYAAPNTSLTVSNLTTDPTKGFGKAGTGEFAASQIRATALQVTGGTLKVLPGGVNRVNSVQLLNATSKMDLTTAPLIVDYTLRTAPGDPTINNNPFPDILAEVLSGFNGGDWQGIGFTSSNAIAQPGTYAVGYIDNGVVGLTTYLGENVDADTIIVRGTRRGDANLDGTVNLADFNRLAGSFGASDAHWWQGDFNYDTVVNLADFNALAGNFGLAATGRDAPTAEDWAALASAVPEPASLSLVALGAGALLRRRRI